MLLSCSGIQLNNRKKEEEKKEAITIKTSALKLDGIRVALDCDMRCEALNIDYRETNSSKKTNNRFYERVQKHYRLSRTK
jgi:hypothetical protein